MMSIAMNIRILLLTSILVTFTLPVFAYSIKITEPAIERAYHRPAQTVEIKASASRLESGYTTAILLDDKLVADGLTYRVPTVDLDIGQHVITAIVMDKQAQTVASDTRVIHIIQTNQIQKKKQAAIAAREEYEAKPWYKKLVIGINPKVQAPQEVDASTPTWEIK